MNTDCPMVKVKRLQNGENLDLPRYETELAAGADVRATNSADAPITLKPGERFMVPTGIAAREHSRPPSMRIRQASMAKPAGTPPTILP